MSSAIKQADHFSIADCKTLAPTWEKVATDFSAEPSVLIAKVDAEADNSKATAEAQDVHSYPTIKYFPKGSTTPVPYEGGRTEEAIVEFMNSKAGTHRLVGGGLDTKAGTIETLDAIIGKIAAGSTLSLVSSEVTKAVASLKDTYAPYYVKVLEKMGKNPEYATKEQTRLQSLLSKGGLTPEKIDDLTSRSNILKRFLGDSTEAKDEL